LMRSAKTLPLDNVKVRNNASQDFMMCLLEIQVQK